MQYCAIAAHALPESILYFFSPLVKPKGANHKMKRKIFAALLLLIFLPAVLCGCGSGLLSDDDGEEYLLEDDDLADEAEDDDRFLDISKEIRGVWFSYLELKAAPKESEKQFSAYILSQFKKLQKLSVNCVFVQVRPFADAIYESEIFPSSSCVVKKRGDSLPFDFLRVICEKGRKCGLSVHAWINPYRILPRGESRSKLCEKSPGKTLSFPDVVEIDEGMFFSPASEKARRLIISGVREILGKYEVDGIHIDDYFYPSQKEKVDSSFYKEYLKGGGTLALDSWRRENVNALVSGIYSAVKESGEDKIFSISPGGDIEKNFSVYYADVERWGKEDGFCDVLIPQIYYGFKNESKPFEKCAIGWRNIVKNDNVRLCAGLALYKRGKEDKFAGERGKNEWKEEELISRQIETLRTQGFDGFCLYSLQFVNFNEKLYPSG